MTEGSIAIIGAGAIGATVGAWLMEAGERVIYLARPRSAERLRAHGVSARAEGAAEAPTFHPPVVVDPADLRGADLHILAVKTYALESAAAPLRDALGEELTVVGLQNGVVSHTILPSLFRRCVFGVVGYNAWLSDVGRAGYRRRGPIVFGGLDAEGDTTARFVARRMSRAFPARHTSRLRDAAYCKLVLNLASSLTALVGHGERSLDDVDTFQRLLTELTWEGVRVVRAAGVREERVPGLPGWALLRAAATLPRPLTRPFFMANVRKMKKSSMSQDLYDRDGGQNELEELNGHLVELADRLGVAAPYNRAIYRLCSERFSQDRFEPLTPAEIFAEVGP